jgi:hypothetical protein
MGAQETELTPEQQEILDSGLRMLAHMIVESHLHRRKAGEASVKTAMGETCELQEHLRLPLRSEDSFDENQAEL